MVLLLQLISRTNGASFIIYFTNSIILLLYFQNILYYSNLIFSTKCNSLTITAPLLSLPGNLDPNTHYNYNNIEEAGNHIDYLPYKIICIKFYLLKLGKATVFLKLFCLGFDIELPVNYLKCIFYFGLLIFCCQIVATSL